MRAFPKVKTWKRPVHCKDFIKDHGIQYFTTLWPELTWICWLDSHGIGCLLVLWKNADSAWPAEAWILQLGRAPDVRPSFWNPWPPGFLLASPPSWGHSFISGSSHTIFIMCHDQTYDFIRIPPWTGDYNGQQKDSNNGCMAMAPMRWPWHNMAQHGAAGGWKAYGGSIYLCSVEDIGQ